MFEARGSKSGLEPLLMWFHMKDLILTIVWIRLHLTTFPLRCQAGMPATPAYFHLGVVT